MHYQIGESRYRDKKQKQITHGGSPQARRSLNLFSSASYPAGHFAPALLPCRQSARK
jgi:hypothetical protein